MGAFDYFDYSEKKKPKKSATKSVPRELGAPKPTRYQKGTGLGQFPAEATNFTLDLFRGGLNAGSDATDFVRGRPANTRAGDRIFGTPASQTKPKPTGKSPWDPVDSGGEVTQDVAGQPELSFADYLAMANELSGGGTDYSALMNQLRGNAGAGDARLNAMYSQLQKSFSDDAAGIGQAYDESAAAQQAANAQAAESVNAGYDRARDSQTEQFKALGIEDAAASIAASGGGTLGGDQAFANANVAQLGNINQQQTQATKAGSLDYNTKITQAAGAEGATQRALLQQALNDKLAELQVAQSSENAQRQDSNWQKASFLADWDNAAAQRRAAQMAGPSLEDQLTEMQIAEQDLKNKQLAAQLTGSSDPATSYAQVQSLAQQAGIDPADQEAMGSFIEQLAKAVKLY